MDHKFEFHNSFTVRSDFRMLGLGLESPFPEVTPLTENRDLGYSNSNAFPQQSHQTNLLTNLQTIIIGAFCPYELFDEILLIGLASSFLP